MIEKIQDEIRDAYESGAILPLGSLLLVIVFLLVLFLQPVSRIAISGYLVGKEYSPAHTETGTGVGVDSNGNTIVTTTTSSEGDKWKIVLVVDGKYKTYDVSPQVYYSLQERSNVTIDCARGNWIHIVSCD
jgi:hypothetical protein